MRAQQPAAATHTPTRSYWPTRPEPLPPPLLAFSPLSLSIPARTRAPRQCGGPPLLLLLLLPAAPPPHRPPRVWSPTYLSSRESCAAPLQSPFPKTKSPHRFSIVCSCLRSAGGGRRRRRHACLLPPTTTPDALLARSLSQVSWFAFVFPICSARPFPLFSSTAAVPRTPPLPLPFQTTAFFALPWPSLSHGPRSPSLPHIPLVHYSYWLPTTSCLCVCLLPSAACAGGACVVGPPFAGPRSPAPPPNTYAIGGRADAKTSPIQDDDDDDRFGVCPSSPFLSLQQVAGLRCVARGAARSGSSSSCSGSWSRRIASPISTYLGAAEC